MGRAGMNITGIEYRFCRFGIGDLVEVQIYLTFKSIVPEL
jgi:hypothetical protein